MGQLLPAILDRRAQSEPDRVWAKFPVSPTSYDQGFRAATYGQMRNAVNRVAWMLVETVGPSSQFDTLAYLGPNDLRYHIVVLAAIKTGYKAFLPSPRNSTVAQRDLLTRLECRVLATTDPEPPFVSSILREYPVETVVRIPPLEELLQDGDHDAPPYPYDKFFEAGRHDPVLVLHTSGSTGIPKPMTYTNEFIWRIYKANTLPAPPRTTRVDNYFLHGEFFSFLPAFHVSPLQCEREVVMPLMLTADDTSRSRALDGAWYCPYLPTASLSCRCPDGHPPRMVSCRPWNMAASTGPLSSPSLSTR
jgi:acyl-CoA synthetase (AMP-forming)/AMP-acid ligase II